MVLASALSVTVAFGLAATDSSTSALELGAVGALLVGSAVAFGGLDDRRRSREAGLAPDRRIAALAAQVLGSLDGIEHRRVELGRPWPQLSVGPMGVAVVDVCGLEGPLVLDGRGISRRDDHLTCDRCSAARAAGDAALRELAPRVPQVPVRTIAVVAAGTEVSLGPDAPCGVSVVTVDELADTLARGPLLPMPVVEASFELLSRTEMIRGLR